MLKVQQSLISREYTLERLKSELGINYRVYEDDGIVILNYDQIESPKTHPFVIECRSLILYLSDWSIASKKFDRFYNLGEAPNTLNDFDFKRACILEKVDGSLTGVWYNRITSRWEISTRSMAFAEGEHQIGGTFRQHILSAFEFDSEREFQVFCNESLQKSWTYVFEWISPLNRIVTPYEKSMMVLTAAYSTDLKYLHPCEFDRLSAIFPNTRSVRFYDYSVESIDELRSSADSLSGLQEGYVVWDPESDKRQKVKSLKYMAVHAMRGETIIPSRKNILKLVLSGETSEVLIYFPEWKPLIEPCEVELEDMYESLRNTYEKVRDIVDQKEFALSLKDYKYSPLLFTARRHNTEPKTIFDSLDISKQLKYFGI